MNWTEFLLAEMKHAFATTEGLIAMVEPDGLDWKPAAGENWLTVGQLLYHIGEACGDPCKGFVTGDWGLPEGEALPQAPPDLTFPMADAMKTVADVAQAKAMFEKDRELALRMVDEAGEEDLAGKPVPAPWDGTPLPLGVRLHQMVAHLESHKHQLFYYLKLMGKPVNTTHLWGG